MADIEPDEAACKMARPAVTGAPRWPAFLVSLCLAATLALASAGISTAAEIQGVHFEDSVDIDGLRLNLNGAGLREIYIVKTWVAALYTARPVHSAATLITGTGPRRIAITLLADVSIDRVARSMLDALRRNHDPILLAAIEPSIREFVAVLRSIGATQKGDTLTLDMMRGMTRVSFNGMAVGEPVSGALFRDALLRAFVGKQPIDEALGRSLLGQPSPGSE